MLKVLLLLGTVAYVHGIVCPENICATVDCAAVDAAACNGYVKQGGGFCGCCDTCVTLIPEGGSCFGTFLIGVPSNAECADGLYCNPSTHKCQTKPAKRDLDSCATKLTAYNQQLAASQHALLGLEQPRCDDNGDYLGMQYAGSTAYCVTKDGHDLSDLGYTVGRWETGPDMNCQCARDLYDYMQSGLIGKLFNCQSNGNYPPTSVPAKREVDSCATKLTAYNQQLAASQHALLGLEQPRCDDNGDYLGMQYAGSTAYCVTKDGHDLSDLGYTVGRWETGADMNCQCARDLYDYMQSGLIGKLFNCQSNGNYPPTSAPAKRQTADGPCAVRLQEVNAQLAASNHMLMGLEKPHCDNNGDYLGMQYAGSQAYCVTLTGSSLNYMVNRWETGNNMDCQCARDEYAYQKLGLFGTMFNCLPNGNYAPVQCTGSVCYCVDNMGQQVGTSTAAIGQQDSLNC